jgi:glutaredoxin
MTIKTILLVLVLMVSVPVVMAERLYKWTDSNGRVTYRDAPPPQGSGYHVEEKKIRGNNRYGGDDENPNTEAASKNPVILYSVPKCVTCDLARAYLQKQKIPFKEVNVVNDPKLQQQLKKVSGSLSVPTITVGKKVMKGYMQSLLEGELTAAGYAKPDVKKTENES